MKEQFPGYYYPPDEDFAKLWIDCLFVFDTNILLNLYRYEITTRNEFIGTLQDAKIKDRIWIPYQVALEYHDERSHVIKSLINAYDEIEKSVKDSHAKIKKRLESCKGRHPIIDVEEIIGSLNSNCGSILEKLEQKKEAHPDWNTKDEIRDKIYTLFDKKVGSPYSQEKLDKIYQEGELRYKYRIPPGYEDRPEKKKFPYKQYGDLVLWLQLIDHSKKVHMPTIFVTDDNKKDWWDKDNGRDSSPRPELIQEFFLETGMAFYAYSPKQFIEGAEKYLNIKFTPKAIDEIERVKQADEKYFGDLPTRSFTFRWDEIDPLPKSEYEKLAELRKKISEEFDRNPDMTEEEVNLLASEIDNDTVKKHHVRIEFRHTVGRSLSLLWSSL
jgi:hypothetical protein